MKLTSPSWIDGSAIARVLDNPLARPGILRELLLALPDGILRAMTVGALVLELAFAPLALFSRTRPIAWAAVLSMHLGLIALIDFADLSLGMVLVHAFTFDPAWIAARKSESPSRVFYDGSCGLCQRFVRFVLAEDRSREAFRFAPLAGETFAKLVPERQRASLPDSVVVLTERGELLVRSAAVIHVLERLGGAWRAFAFALRAVPGALRDRGYDLLARVRKRIFAPPSDACPLAPAELTSRLDP
jgi:predicted DCC family thiol-disulfide oxidoreductase YuxK